MAGQLNEKADGAGTPHQMQAHNLTIVAEGPPPDPSILIPDFADLLQDAVVAGDDQATRVAISRMHDAGISREAIIDYYIPSIARNLGDAWTEDEMSFATVTIGTARMQQVLRDLAPGWHSEKRRPTEAAAILLLVPADNSHTLGATVLVGQLRRMGFSVHLLVGAEVGDLTDRVGRSRFDAVFISTSCTSGLESVRKLVHVIRTLLPDGPPVVVGGPMIECIKDVIARTGADHATSDLEEGLRFCNLATNQTATALRHGYGG
jgi:methanogenic corrinoid protein MtbC1